MEDRQLEQIEGTIEDIIFENSDSGYVVFELSGEGRLTVVCGTLGELHVGQSVICRGRYENHATYGRQFHAAECLTDMPKDIDAVYAFLASRSLPYVGPATARKIIETFGASALDVIANDPARLTQIKGISADKADRIQQEFKRMFGMRELIAYLAQFEIGPRRAMEVFRAFGPGAVQAVASNPYLLCGEPLQLDFRHADSIAAYYQMEGDSPQRLEAALLRTLRHNAGNGHTCLPRERLVATASAFIHQPPEKLTAALEHCLETGQLETRTLSAGEYIYLPDLLAAEEAIAARLAALARRDKQTARHLDQDIQVLEAAQGFAYAPEQREAIRQAVTENCLVLTGGPGTGKTTTVKAVLNVLESQAERVALCAPTGRAAKRLSELTGRKASTIHRLLEVDYTGGRVSFIHNERNLLKCDVVILDEMSMVDVQLFQSLLAALRPNCRVIMVGDADQCPPSASSISSGRPNAASSWRTPTTSSADAPCKRAAGRTTSFSWKRTARPARSWSATWSPPGCPAATALTPSGTSRCSAPPRWAPAAPRPSTPCCRTCSTRPPRASPSCKARPGCSARGTR